MSNPLSFRLNCFIEIWWEAHKDLFKVYEASQFDFMNPDKTILYFIQHYHKHGTIPMWYDDNKDNIFGNTKVNAKFRAWHDYMHVTTANDFSLQGEINTYKAQAAMLPDGWEYEKKLLQAEIIGQALYYTTAGKDAKPIASQRKFATDYILTII